MKRKLTALLAALCITAVLPVHAGAVDLPLTSRAAVLMEKTTGQMLFAQNEHEKLEPASVTKIMTLLLTMDAIDSGALAYDDVVTVSANAAGMGGSQVFLAEGEQITVEELLKCVCVSSGNDAAVALAEKVIADDDTVDAYFDKVKQALIRRIADGPAEGGTALELLMIAKYLERIGDHATNIAECVEFSVTGVHKEE